MGCIISCSMSWLKCIFKRKNKDNDETTSFTNPLNVDDIDLIECPNCYNELDILPQVNLDCGHIYCESCYIQIIRSTTIDKSRKICSICCQKLSSSTYIIKENKVINQPIALQDNLKTNVELINILTFLDLENPDLESLNDLKNKGHPGSALFKITKQSENKTEFSMTLVPDIRTDAEGNNINIPKKFEIKRRTFLDDYNRFQKYFILIIGNDYGIWFMDVETNKFMSDKMISL